MVDSTRSDDAPIRTRFTASSTAAEVAAGQNLQGMNVVVTGGASGIGLETARALAAAGAVITLAVRDLQVGARAANELGAGVRVARLDLADLASVAAFTAAWVGPLHLLVNNAGVMRLPTLQRAGSGAELQFATNHLGHYALACGLHPALAAGARDRGAARIVAVASRANLDAGVDFDDVHFHRRPYDPGVAYGQSKTANVLFAVEATRRWYDDGIVANAVNPGGVATGLQRHLAADDRAAVAANPSSRTPQQGAATTLVAALGPEYAHTGGLYLENCQPAATVADDADEHSAGVRARALDPDAARRLWEVSDHIITTGSV